MYVCRSFGFKCMAGHSLGVGGSPQLCVCPVCLSLARLGSTLLSSQQSEGFRDFWLGRLRLFTAEVQDSAQLDQGVPVQPTSPLAPPGGTGTLAPAAGVPPGPAKPEEPEEEKGVEPPKTAEPQVLPEASKEKKRKRSKERRRDKDRRRSRSRKRRDRDRLLTLTPVRTERKSPGKKEEPQEKGKVRKTKGSTTPERGGKEEETGERPPSPRTRSQSKKTKLTSVSPKRGEAEQKTPIARECPEEASGSKEAPERSRSPRRKDRDLEKKPSGNRLPPVKAEPTPSPDRETRGKEKKRRDPEEREPLERKPRGLAPKSAAKTPPRSSENPYKGSGWNYQKEGRGSWFYHQRWGWQYSESKGKKKRERQEKIHEAGGLEAWHASKG